MNNNQKKTKLIDIKSNRSDRRQMCKEDGIHPKNQSKMPYTKNNQGVEMISQEVLTLACFLYSEYCKSVGGLAYNGDLLPTWGEFYNDDSKSKQSNAWINTAYSLLSKADSKLDKGAKGVIFNLNINKLKESK